MEIANYWYDYDKSMTWRFNEHNVQPYMFMTLLCAQELISWFLLSKCWEAGKRCSYFWSCQTRDFSTMATKVCRPAAEWAKVIAGPSVMNHSNYIYVHRSCVATIKIKIWFSDENLMFKVMWSLSQQHRIYDISLQWVFTPLMMALCPF